MRFVRILVVVLLIASLTGNGIAYMRFVRGRAQVQVNGLPITTKDFNAFLSMRYGIQSMATMVQQTLALQACQKQGLKIDKGEIDEAIATIKETNPASALQLRREPYREDDLRKSMEYMLAMAALRTKDVAATDDEVRDYFASQPGKWDKPDKIEIKAVRCTDAGTAAKAESMFKSGVTDMAVLQRQLDPRGTMAQAIGLDGKVVVVKPFGKPSKDPLINKVAGMKDGEVGTVAARNGVLVIRRVSMTPGKAVTLDEVKPKVEREFKLTRALPEKEVLRKLWDEAKIETDDPKTKAEVQWLLFREPVQSAQQ